MTSTYQKRDIGFIFPENWKLNENETEGSTQISLESPQACQWDLYIFDSSMSEADWVKQLMVALSEQFDSFESQPLELAIGKYQLHGFEAFFYCLDLLVSAHLLELPKKNEEHRVLMYQGESREFDRNLEVFHAITISLLTHGNH